MKQQAYDLPDRKARWAFVERQLRDYRINKSLLENYRQGGAEAAPAMSCLRLTRGAPGRGGSLTEKQAIELVELAQQISKLSWYVTAIDDLLNIASPEEKALLETRYFQPRPLTAWQVANQLFISRTEFYRRRDLLISWLEKRFGLLMDEVGYPATGEEAAG